MNIHKLLSLGDFGTNCYILENSEGNALLIDAPYSAGIISARIDSLGLRLKKILLTHGHCDHIEALNGLYKKYGCEVYISEEDAPMLTDGALCKAEYFGTHFEPFFGAKTLSDGEEISLGDITLKVIATPGHTRGSVSFLAEECIFTGDTLFEGSVGRTDLGGGDFDLLIQSIGRLMGLGRNYTVYPGHGGASDLESELKFNPFLERLRK